MQPPESLGDLAFLQSLTTNQLDKSVGSVTYTLMLDDAGGIRSDVTVARLEPDVFQVGINGNIDIDHLLRYKPADVRVADITGGTCCLGVWGPLARDLVQPLSREDFSHTGLKYFRGRKARIAGVPVGEEIPDPVACYATSEPLDSARARERCTAGTPKEKERGSSGGTLIPQITQAMRSE